MNKRKLREPRAIERVEAMFARFRATEHDPAALEALMEDSLAEMDARLADDRKKMDETRKKMDTFVEDVSKLTEMVEQLGQLAAARPKADPHVQRKRQAAVIRREQRRKWAATVDREIEVRAAELRQRGVRNPVEQAVKGIAEQRGTTVDALNRRRRRNR